jgi:hypothetical protein
MAWRVLGLWSVYGSFISFYFCHVFILTNGDCLLAMRLSNPTVARGKISLSALEGHFVQKHSNLLRRSVNSQSQFYLIRPAILVSLTPIWLKKINISVIKTKLVVVTMANG